MFRFILLGKTKNGYMKEAFEDYVSRIKKLSKIEVVELKEEKDRDMYVALSKEKKKILAACGDEDYVIVLDSRGEELTSREFSDHLKKNRDKNISFIIGSANGLDEDVVKTSNFKLSFSKMTFTHQMIRVILAEQLYRGLTIMKNLPYHK